ncbi:MAG: hypothetical protein NTX61_06340 [Bacteroidetes bacterium]|nr:hypothetical protein [Bacteroidota bacterium]
MKKIKLQHFLRIITHWNERNSDIRDELYFEDVSVVNEALDQFSFELGENISTLVKFKKKREVIKFYIQRFSRAVHISDENKSIWDNSISLDDFITKKGNRQGRLNKLYVEPEKQVHEILVVIFNEIQLVCNQHNIPFLEICKEVNFPINTIKTEVTKAQRNGNSIKLKPSKKSSDKTEVKPVFETGYIDEIFNVFKGYFPESQQQQLLSIFKDGGNGDEPLLFMDSGVRLADAFKQFFDAGIIVACQKKELEKWIMDNFSYRYRNKTIKFKAKYLNDIISTKKDLCQKPLINITPDRSSGRYFITKF